MIPLTRHAELVSASISVNGRAARRWTLKQVQGDGLTAAVEAEKFLGISLEGSVG